MPKLRKSLTNVETPAKVLLRPLKLLLLKSLSHPDATSGPLEADELVNRPASLGAERGWRSRWKSSSARRG
jgi:hypothetical protein